jgi:predicted amidohydrolase YtcJ
MTSGQVLGSGERLTRLGALRALTAGGAWVTFAERERGMLAPGRQADLAVLEEDPLTASLTDIESLACRLTMVGGRLVHGDD